MGEYDINFLAAGLNKLTPKAAENNNVEAQYVTPTFDVKEEAVTGEDLLAQGINTNEVFGANFTNKVVSAPVFSAEDLDSMFELAGVAKTDAANASATPEILLAMEEVGLNIEDLEDIFAEEPEVIAQTMTAFSNGSAARITNASQPVAALMDAVPEDASPNFFEAFMYAINEDRTIS